MSALENGRYLREIKLFDEAIEAFKKFIIDHPKDTMGYKELSFTYSLLKKYEDSIKYINVALIINSQDAYCYFNKGQAYLYLDKIPEAIELFKKAIEIKPNNSVYLNQLGLAQVEIKDYSEAIKSFEKAFEITPKELYLNNMADVYIKSNQPEKAVEKCLEANKMNPKYAMAYSNLAEAYQMLKKYEESLLNYSKAIELEANLVFYKNRGDFYNNILKKKKEALNDYNIAYELTKTESVGNVFLTQKGFQEIIELVEKEREKLQKLLSDVDEIHEDLEKVIQKMENKEAQSKLLEKFKELREKKAMIKQEQEISSKLQIASAIKEESEKMMKRLLKTEKKLAKQYKTMKTSGIVDMAFVNEEFKKLKEFMELHNYAKVFYWTLLNYLGAYRSLSTNLQSANYDHDSLKDKHTTILDGISKVTKFASAACEGIPIVESVIGIIDNIVDIISNTSKEKKFENRVNAINRIIMFNQDENSLEQGLSTTIGKAAVSLARKRKKEILSEKTNSENEENGLMKWFTTSIEALKSKLSGEKKVELYDSPSAIVALKDVILVLSYMYKNYDKITDSLHSLDKQIIDIIYTGKGEDMLNKDINYKNDDQNDEAFKDKAQCSCACKIFTLGKIIYDNPLLNKFEYMQSLIHNDKYDSLKAVGLSKIIDIYLSNNDLESVINFLNDI